MAIIKTRNLTKDYGGNRGIYNINLEVNKGEIFDFYDSKKNIKMSSVKFRFKIALK